MAWLRTLRRLTPWMLWCSIAVAQPLDATKIYKACAPAVVYIETPSGSGSGFLVHPQYVVTNKHVIKRPWLGGYYAAWQIEVKTRSGSSLRVLDVKPLEDYSDIDLAVLKVARFQGTPLPIYPGVAEVGEPVVAIGHPRAMQWSQTQGSISKNDLQYHYQLDVATDFGSSGGPVINRWGQVVAVVQGMLLLSATGRFGIRSDVLKQLLDTYGIPYTTAPLLTPTAADLSALQEQLAQERQQLIAERIELERQRAQFQTELQQARPFLAEYAQKRSQLEQKEQELDRRERELEERERALERKAARIAEKLGERFALEFLLGPAYDIWQEQFVLSRASAGLFYRFGFVRDEEGYVVRADQFGIMASRDIVFLRAELSQWNREGIVLGWRYDELALALEFSSLVRLSFGLVLRQFDPQRNLVTIPAEPRYTVGVLLDALPESAFLFGVGATAHVDRRLRPSAVSVGLQVGYALHFLRW